MAGRGTKKGKGGRERVGGRTGERTPIIACLSSPTPLLCPPCSVSSAPQPNLPLPLLLYTKAAMVRTRKRKGESESWVTIQTGEGVKWPRIKRGSLLLLFSSVLSLCVCTTCAAPFHYSRLLGLCHPLFCLCTAHSCSNPLTTTHPDVLYGTRFFFLRSFASLEKGEV